MWFGLEPGWQAALFALIFLVAFYVQRIDGRVRLMKMRLDRLSLTFLKIENDLSAVQDSLVVISQSDPDAAKLVEIIRNNRDRNLRDIIEDGPNRAEILRGLEFPDIDDDKSFWADDRMKRFGFEENDESKSDP